METKINIAELKGIISRINLAVEKNNKLNPKSGWIELETVSNTDMKIKVGNFTYYLEADVAITASDYSDDNKIHVTVSADTFIPLISKLDDDFVTIDETMNALMLRTSTSEYTFPIIKDANSARSVGEISFNTTLCSRYTLDGSDLLSVANANVQGLVDALFSKDIQRYIYMDNYGALTFTENIYINNFKYPCTVDDNTPEFKILLTSMQAKLLDVFAKYKTVEMAIESSSGNSSVSFKVKFTSKPLNDITLVLIVQPMDIVNKFPSIKLRQLASNVSGTHAFIDKRTFDKALARLMVFDKKWDISVLNYSKLVFGKDCVKLVSTKNKNYEVVKYDRYENTTEHESIVRFADLTNQLKAVSGDTIDISYGDSPAIVINSGNLCQLIPEISERV